MYQWVKDLGLDLPQGAALSKNHPWAKSMAVLIINYYKKQFPPQLVGKFGRCYQIDDRIAQKDWVLSILNYIKFLSDEGIRSTRGKRSPPACPPPGPVW